MLILVGVKTGGMGRAIGRNSKLIKEIEKYTELEDFYDKSLFDIVLQIISSQEDL